MYTYTNIVKLPVIKLMLNKQYFLNFNFIKSMFTNAVCMRAYYHIVN